MNNQQKCIGLIEKAFQPQCSDNMPVAMEAKKYEIRRFTEQLVFLK